MITRKADHAIDIRTQMRGGSGDVRLEALMPQLPNKTRLFSTITLAPGCSIGVHEHTGETELFYFASGCGRVCDDGEYYDVQAGDAMSTGSGHSHGVENTGTEDLVLVAVIILD